MKPNHHHFAVLSPKRQRGVQGYPLQPIGSASAPWRRAPTHIPPRMCSGKSVHVTVHELGPTSTPGNGSLIPTYVGTAQNGDAELRTIVQYFASKVLRLRAATVRDKSYGAGMCTGFTDR
jgi:hypothetical protein